MTFAAIKIQKQHSRKGIALIMVMIVTVVLGILAAGFAYTMKVETKLARNASFDSEIEWIGRSGIEVARWYLTLPSNPQTPDGKPVPAGVDWLGQPWAGGMSDTNSPSLMFPLKGLEVGGGTADITIVDLDRKININTVPPDLLNSVLQDTVGIDSTWASVIVDAVIDWRDRDDNKRPSGAESDDYANNPNPGYPPYKAKNGNIDEISELLMIRGVTPAIYWGPEISAHPQHKARGGQSALDEQVFTVGLVQLFTATSSGQVNINTADAATLDAVLPFDIAWVNEFIIQNRPLANAGAIPFGLSMSSMPPGGPGPRGPVAPGVLPPPGGAPPGANPMAQFTQILGARSQFFQVTVDASVGGRTRKYVALIRRMSPRDIKVMNMYWL